MELFFIKNSTINIMASAVFQKNVLRTLLQEPNFKITPQQVMLAWNVIGLTGEAGEVADLVKKGVFHQHGLDNEKIKKELGDVLWYLTAICDNLGFTLEDVMTANVEKLKARYPDGFNVQDSIDKKDKANPIFSQQLKVGSYPKAKKSLKKRFTKPQTVMVKIGEYKRTRKVNINALSKLSVDQQLSGLFPKRTIEFWKPWVKLSVYQNAVVNCLQNGAELMVDSKDCYCAKFDPINSKKCFYEFEVPMRVFWALHDKSLISSDISKPQYYILTNDSKLVFTKDVQSIVKSFEGKQLSFDISAFKNNSKKTVNT